MPSTKISLSNRQTKHLRIELQHLVDALKSDRDALSRQAIQGDKLDKGRVDAVYNLRYTEAALANAELAMHAIRFANINLSSVVKGDGDAD